MRSRLGPTLVMEKHFVLKKLVKKMFSIFLYAVLSQDYPEKYPFYSHLIKSTLGKIDLVENGKSISNGLNSIMNIWLMYNKKQVGPTPESNSKMYNKTKTS